LNTLQGKGTLMRKNIIMQTDSYKVGHDRFYNPKLRNIFAYFESRGGDYKNSTIFGLQYYLKEYLQGRVVTKEKIDYAEKFFKEHFMGVDYFRREKWDYILNYHQGRLPVKISAVPEGAVVPIHNIMMSITATDERCFWLPNYLETMLSKVWYPSTIAIQGRKLRRKILEILERNGTPELIDSRVHDFAYRGVTSEEQSGLGSASHLLSFGGTDSLPGIMMLQDYYNTTTMMGVSVPATEHSIPCSFGEDEEAYIANALREFPDGFIATVGDTWNIYKYCSEKLGGTFRDAIIHREGCLIARPDSGDYEGIIPKLLRILGDKFGTSKIKGYNVLDPHIRLIQGDGMNPRSIVKLYEMLDAYGWSADNLATGSGGGLLQNVHRDTQKWAFKGAGFYVKEDDGRYHWFGQKKDPITDPGKTSKEGILYLVENDGVYETRNLDLDGVTHLVPKMPCEDVLIPVFRDGEILQEYTYEEVKANLHAM